MTDLPLAELPPELPTNAFYGARLFEFIADDPEAVVGALTRRAALEFRGSEREQARAWHDQVRLLHSAIAELPTIDGWSILLEYSLRRLGRRPDAVLLAPGVIIVVEFKMGGEVHAQQHLRQVEDYALCIRDFHGAARGVPIVPLLCAYSSDREQSFHAMVNSARSG